MKVGPCDITTKEGQARAPAAPAGAAELTAALAKDLDAHFEQVVLLYQGPVYGFALRLTGQPPEAEEIAQDALVRAYRALGTYPAARIQTMALLPWLFQITLNLTRNRHRRGKWQPVVSLEGVNEAREGPAIEPADDERERPLAMAEQRETGHELAGLLAELPPRYRDPIVLRYIEDRPYDEIARLLAQPVGTVKANVHRGLRQLRQAVEQTNQYQDETKGQANGTVRADAIAFGATTDQRARRLA